MLDSCCWLHNTNHISCIRKSGKRESAGFHIWSSREEKNVTKQNMTYWKLVGEIKEVNN